MKAVILGDPHFGVGYSLGKTDKIRRFNTRLLDFASTFDYVIDYMISNEIGVLIITGDIFEYRRPKPCELSIFAEKIQRLEEHGIQTHIVAGNHDIIADERTTTIDVLQKLKLPGTFVYSDVGSVICEDGENTMNFVFLPYRTRNILDCSSNKEAIERVSERINYEVDKFSKGNKFLVGHFMFKQTMLGNLTLERNADEVVFPMGMFSDFNGTIAGHIHQHQILQKEPLVCYIGSMDRKDFGESEMNQYFLVVDNSSGDIVFQFENLPTRKLYDIKFDLSNITDKKEFVRELKKQLVDYSEDKNLINSIVRITVFINSNIITEFDREEIKIFLKTKLKINNCVGIHPLILSKKQLRKSTITEAKDPSEAFVEYVKDILISEDELVREEMVEKGLEIIKGHDL